MSVSRIRVAAVLSSLLLVILMGFVAIRFMPEDVSLVFQHYLMFPLFNVAGLSVTLLFLVKVIVFFVALFLVSHFTMRLLQGRILIHTPLERGQQYALARVSSYLVIVFGMVIGMQSLGLNLSSLVVVGGALGIGVGLGLQPIVTNFVAGLILLFEQPVRLGDRIEVGNTNGDVVRLRGRSTWIRTNDNVVMIVPNSEFINNRVTNWTANDRQVRISLTVGVSYNSDPEQVRSLLVGIAGRHPDVLGNTPPEVIFCGFGDNALNFELRVWTVTQVQTPARLKSDLYFSIFSAFKVEGIEIPFPQRDLHLKSVSGDTLSNIRLASQN
ncbi:MAG: mechanosensitive ion channel family protein [Actinomycetota bacterium]